MTAAINKSKNAWLLMPLFGSIIFVCLYFVAAYFYPGGSQVDKNSIGFSWTQNYWCNLLNEDAINGEHNTARPVAIAAMFVLCCTLGCFWYIFSLQTSLQKGSRIVIQVSGMISMITGMFLFTNLHDAIVNAASFFGIIATAGTFITLYKLRWNSLFGLGIFNLVLVALNNILYYGDGLQYLPVVQKITFLVFLVWICLININLYNHPVKQEPVYRK
ncbi:MAG: hypothetical protein ABI921_11315 [Panacibacter sp.]